MSFLILPREIRDQIYFFVIHFERDAPPSPPHESISTGYRVKDDQTSEVWRNNPTVHHEDGPLLLPCTCLARTNHQIRAEVREALITVRNSAKLVYKLDLMVDDRHIYLTWLSVPAPAKRLAELRVDVRRVSDSSLDRRWWAGDGTRPGSMNLTLARLLSRFIAHGPTFFGETHFEGETLFDVLTLRVVDTEFLNHFSKSRISPHDYSGLKRCASLLTGCNILGCKTQLVRVRYRDEMVEHEFDKTPASRDCLATWRRYGWYEVPALPG